MMLYHGKIPGVKLLYAANKPVITDVVYWIVR